MNNLTDIQFEEIELELVDLFCAKEKISLDIGTAGRGPYTEQMIPVSRHVYSFEPHPISAQKMCEKYGDTITLMEYAVSDYIGTTTLSVPLRENTHEEKPGWSSIKKDFEESDLKYVQYEVKTTTIDGQNLPPISFIKIDVEGAEIEVLKGGINTIKKYRPYVLLEMDENHRKGTLRTNYQFFQQLDYNGYYIKNFTIYSIEKFIESGRKNDLKIGGTNIYNFIFIPNEKVALLDMIKERLSTLQTQV